MVSNLQGFVEVEWIYFYRFEEHRIGNFSDIWFADQNIRELPLQPQSERMEFPTSTILTPYNYYVWKPMIFLHLMSKGLYQIVMGIET